MDDVAEDISNNWQKLEQPGSYHHVLQKASLQLINLAVHIRDRNLFPTLQRLESVPGQAGMISIRL